jgi:hypothetical protein
MIAERWPSISDVKNLFPKRHTELILPVPFPARRNLPGMNDPSDRLQFSLIASICLRPCLRALFTSFFRANSSREARFVSVPNQTAGKTQCQEWQLGF